MEQPPTKRRKARVACTYCRSHKLKCLYQDPEDPSICDHCLKYGIPCKFESHTSLPTTEDTAERTRKTRSSSSTTAVRAQSVPDFSPRPSNPLEPRLLGATSITYFVHEFGEGNTGGSHDVNTMYGIYRAEGDHVFTQTRPDINTPGVVERQLSVDVLSSLLRVYIDQIAPLSGIILPSSVCTIEDPTIIPPITLAACAIASASRKSPRNVFLALRSKLLHTLQGEVMGVSNLKNVQTLMIVCMTAELHGRNVSESGSAVWLRTGTAIRQAQDLGFHCEPGPLYTGELLEQRVRAWLSCIVTDQWYSISFGRPPMINPDYCDDPLTFCPKLEGETASFRFQLQMYKFSKLACRISPMLLTRNGLAKANDADLYSLLDDIDRAIADIPDEFAFHGMATSQQGGLLYMLVCCIEVTFFREFVVRKATIPQHIQFRVRAARWYTVVTRASSVIDWAAVSGGFLMDTWFIAYYCLAYAALVQFHTSITTGDEEALRSLKKACKVFQEYAAVNRDGPLAVRVKVADIIELLYETANRRMHQSQQQPRADVALENNLELLSHQASTVENPPPDWSSLVAATDMPDFDLSVFSDVFDLDFAAVMSNVRYDAAGVWQGNESTG